MSVSSKTQEQRANTIGVVFSLAILSTPFLGWLLIGVIFVYAVFAILIRSSNRIVDILVLLGFGFAFYLGWVLTLVFGGQNAWWFGLVALSPLTYLFLRFTRKFKK